MSIQSKKTAKTFKALNEFVQILPREKETKKTGGVIMAEVTKEKPAVGKVLSVGEGRYLADGTLVKADIKVGDEVVYNPHMIGYELEEDGVTTVLVSSNVIYGKY